MLVSTDRAVNTFVPQLRGEWHSLTVAINIFLRKGNGRGRENDPISSEEGPNQYSSLPICEEARQPLKGQGVLKVKVKQLAESICIMP